MIDVYNPVSPVIDTLEEAEIWSDGIVGYALDLWDAGSQENPVDSIYLVYVNSVQAQMMQSVDRSFTLTNMIEQYSGIRERIYTISGKSGDQYADIVKFKKMENFFTQVALLKSSTENAFFHEKRYRVRLQMFNEHVDVEATILNFTYKREAGVNTNSFDYQLVIAARHDFSSERGTALETPTDPPTIEEPTAVGEEASEDGVKPNDVQSESGTAVDADGVPDAALNGTPSLALKYVRWGSFIPDPFNDTDQLYPKGSGATKAETEDFFWVKVGYVKESRYARLVEGDVGLNGLLYWEGKVRDIEGEITAEEIANAVLLQETSPKLQQLEVELEVAKYGLSDVKAALDPDFRAKIILLRILQLKLKGSSMTELEKNELQVLEEASKRKATEVDAIKQQVQAGSREGGSKRRSSLGPAGTQLASLAGGFGIGDVNSDNFMAKTKRLAKDAGRVADATKTIKQATSAPAKASTNWLDDVYKFVGGTDATLYNGIVTTLTAPLTEIKKIRNYVAPLVSGLSNISYSARSLVGTYYNYLPEWKSYAFGTVAAIRGSFESMKQTYGTLEDMTSERYWRELGRGWEDIWGPSSPTRRQMSVYLPTSSTPVSPVPVPGGVSSAYDAALRLLGRRDRWKEIVTTNNMRDAYTKQDGLPLKAGDTIFIPDKSGTPSQTIELRGTLGSDLMIKNGDLVLRGDHSFQIVEGSANFQQNMSHRVRTTAGSNRVFPSFGLPKTLNERQTSILISQFRSNLMNQVYEDRRVKKVKSIRVVEFPTKYVARVEIELANMETKTISLEYTPAI